MTHFTFSVPDITCYICVGAISGGTQLPCRLEGMTILKRRVNLSNKTITIDVEEDIDEASAFELLKKHLDAIGYKCEPFRKGLSSWHKGAMGLVSGLGMMAVSWFTVPWVALAILGSLSVVLTLFLGTDMYKKAWSRWMENGEVGMDALFAISTTTAMVVSCAALFVPGLPMLFDVGLLIFGFRHMGLAIEGALDERLGISLGFEDCLPDEVQLVTDEQNNTTSMKRAYIQIGDIIIIQPGEIIPLDAVCDDDHEHSIYDTIKTGSLIPNQVKRDAPLLSGMKLSENSPHVLRCRVTKDINDSYLAVLDQQVQRAYTPTERYGLTLFVLAIFVLALCSGIGVGLYFSTKLAIRCAVSVLVSACPCTLGLITSLSLKVGMKRTCDNDVLFQHVDALQDTQALDTFVFDLNGTLTAGEPTLPHYRCVVQEYFDNDDSFLAFCAFLEAQSGSEHATARLIRQAALERQVKSSLKPAVVTAQDEGQHSGIRLQINNRWFTLGNQDMMTAYDIDTSQVAPQGVRALDTVLYLAVGGTVVGYLVTRDTLRPDAKGVLAALTSAGKQVHLCTGTDEDLAQQYASHLGIPSENVCATCTPEQKVAYLETLKEQKKAEHLAMVWDGLNDVTAASSTHCDVNFVIEGQGASVAQASANIKNGRLSALLYAIEISKQTAENIQQNLAFSLTYNLLVMGMASGVLLGVGVVLPPGLGAGLMVLQTCLIMLNVSRFETSKLQTSAVPEEDSYATLQQDLSAQAAQESATMVPMPGQAPGTEDASVAPLSLHSSPPLPQMVYSHSQLLHPA